MENELSKPIDVCPVLDINGSACRVHLTARSMRRNEIKCIVWAIYQVVIPKFAPDQPTFTKINGTRYHDKKAEIVFWIETNKRVVATMVRAEHALHVK